MAYRNLALAFCLFASALSSPIMPLDSHPVVRHDDPGNNTQPVCSGDVFDYPDPQCWGILNVEGFLNDWFQKTPNCSASVKDKCCSPGTHPETWSQCFLRLTFNTSLINCDSFAFGTCELENQVVPASFGAEQAPRRYVAMAIYQINTFFINWYYSMDSAIKDTADACVEILNFLAPEVPQGVGLNTILSVFTIGLALIPSPLTPGLAAAARVGSTAAIGAVQQAPFVGRLVWPSGTTDARLQQLGEVLGSLRGASSTLSDRLSAGKHQAMSDLPSFLNMTRGGAFSGSRTFDVIKDKRAIGLALRTYVTSLAMQNNEWETYWGPNMTDGLTPAPASQESTYGCAWQQNNAACYYEGRGRGKNKQPSGWAEYTSSKVNKSFAVYPYFAKKKNTTPADLFRKMTNDTVSNSNNTAWADLGLMFESSYECSLLARQGNFFDRTPKWDIQSDGSFKVQCLGQLQMGPGCYRPRDSRNPSRILPEQCDIFYNSL